MKGKAVPVIDYAQVKLPKDFAALVRESREVGGMIKVLKARKDEISEELIPAMMTARVKSVSVDGASVTLARGKNVRIDGKLLLEKGVSSDIILYATVEKTYDYVTVGGGHEAE